MRAQDRCRGACGGGDGLLQADRARDGVAQRLGPGGEGLHAAHGGLLLGGAAEELVPEEDEDGGRDSGDGPPREQQDDDAGAGGDRTALAGEPYELGGPFARLLLLVLGLGGQSADRDGEQREAAADGDAARERVQDGGREQPTHRAESVEVHGQLTPVPAAGQAIAVLDQVFEAGEGRVRHDPAVRRLGEHLAGQDTSVDAVDLADGGDHALKSPARLVVVAPLNEDDEVHRARDEHLAGLDGQPLGGLERVRGNTVEDLAGAVGVDRGQRAVVALGHRVQHGHDLVAEDLTDDDARGVHTQRPPDQLRHRNGALALGVGQPLLERHDVRVQIGELVEAELQGALDGDEALVRRDLVRQGPQEGGLTGVGRARDHDVLAGPDGTGEEVPDVGGERAVADEVGHEDLAHARATDGERRAPGHVHDGGEPGPVRQPQVELRVGGVEGPGGESGVRAEDLDELDELLVGLGDGIALGLLAVGVADEDLVVPVDVDVLDLGVVQQRLQTPHPEERGVHGGGVLLLGLGVQRRTPGVDLRTGVLLQYLGYHRAGVVPLVLVGHRRDAGDLVEPALLGDTVTGLLPEPLDQLVVDRCHRPAPAVG